MQLRPCKILAQTPPCPFAERHKKSIERLFLSATCRRHFGSRQPAVRIESKAVTEDGVSVLDVRRHAERCAGRDRVVVVLNGFVFGDAREALGDAVAESESFFD